MKNEKSESHAFYLMELVYIEESFVEGKEIFKGSIFQNMFEDNKEPTPVFPKLL